jgi:hypothetical protein
VSDFSGAFVAFMAVAGALTKQAATSAASNATAKRLTFQ